MLVHNLDELCKDFHELPEIYENFSDQKFVIKKMDGSFFQLSNDEIVKLGCRFKIVHNEFDKWHIKLKSVYQWDKHVNFK